LVGLECFLAAAELLVVAYSFFAAARPLLVGLSLQVLFSSRSTIVLASSRKGAAKLVLL
jgi:hypothetical protein